MAAELRGLIDNLESKPLFPRDGIAYVGVKPMVINDSDDNWEDLY